MISSHEQLSEHNLILTEKLKAAVSILRHYRNIHKQFRSLVDSLLRECERGIREANETNRDQAPDEKVKTIIALVDIELGKNYPKKIIDLLESVRNELTRLKIEHPVFSVPKEKLTRDEIQFCKIDRICFRGDDRDPDTIFKEGFKPYAKGNDVILSPFESESDNIIALSSRFTAATFFPLNPCKTRSFVYVAKVRYGFDVHQHGYKAFAEKGIDEKSANLLFVDEIVTDEIPPEDILAAAFIIRMPYKSSADLPEYMKMEQSQRSVDDEAFIEFYTKCGSYMIVYYRMNPYCTLVPEEKKRVEAFLRNEIDFDKKSKNALHVPMPTSGYSRNNLFSRTVSNVRNDNYREQEKPSCEKHLN
jgi:hypothetical protein